MKQQMLYGCILMISCPGSIDSSEFQHSSWLQRQLCSLQHSSYAATVTTGYHHVRNSPYLIPGFTACAITLVGINWYYRRRYKQLTTQLNVLKTHQQLAPADKQLVDQLLAQAAFKNLGSRPDVRKVCEHHINYTRHNRNLSFCSSDIILSDIDPADPPIDHGITDEHGITHFIQHKATIFSCNSMKKAQPQ